MPGTPKADRFSGAARDRRVLHGVTLRDLSRAGHHAIPCTNFARYRGTETHIVHP